MIIQGTKVQKFIGYFNRDPRNFYQYLLAAKKGSHHGRSLRRTGEIPFTTSTHNAVGGPIEEEGPPKKKRRKKKKKKKSQKTKTPKKKKCFFFVFSLFFFFLFFFFFSFFFLFFLGCLFFFFPPRTAVHRPESQNFTSGTVCAPSSAAK